MTTATKTYRATVKAFSCESAPIQHRLMVDRDTVRVYDEVAGHYTTCHSLDRRVVAAILAIHRRKTS